MATHMEALNHCLLTCRAARGVDANEAGDAVKAPDGETVEYLHR